MSFIAGAAAATAFSQIVSGLMVIHYFTLSRRSTMKLRFHLFRLGKTTTLKTAELGFSSFLQQFTGSISQSVLLSCLALFATAETATADVAQASVGITVSIGLFFLLPAIGISSAIQPIISYNFGAGKFDRVKMTIKRMISITFLAAFVYVVFAMLRPGLFARLFTTDEDLIALVKKVLPVYIAGMSVFGVQSGVQSSFLGLGQAKISLCIALLRKVILLIPLALILPRFFGVMGVYYAEPVADILSVLTASTLFLLNIRKILSKEMLAKVTHTT